MKADKNKKDTTNPKTRKGTDESKRSTLSKKSNNKKSVKKKSKSPALKPQKRSIVKKTGNIKRPKRSTLMTDDNIFADSLPAWIIKPPRNKSKKKTMSRTFMVLALFASFVLLFFVLKKPALKHPDTTVPAKKTETIEKRSTESYSHSLKRESSLPTKKVILPAKNIVPIKKTIKQIKREPYLVFVLDDLGNTNKHKELLIDLEDNVTYAILPFLPYSEMFSRLSLTTNAEVILHLPIESIRGQEKDPGKISPDMSKDQVIEQLNRNFNAVPFCVGANNHKGSLGTSDIRLMRIILTEIKKRGIFFLDSYTTSDSVVSSISQQLGLPLLRRDIFLDNDNSPQKIDIQISKLAETARKKGYAIGIGHYRYNTLAVLKKRIPELKKQGFSLISLKELIPEIENKGLYD